MIIAAVLVAIGLLVGAWAATRSGYRLSGVVVVSLLAIYTLVDLAALPVFVASGVLAYLAIGWIQEHWLLYGRPLLLAAIFVGAILPVATVVVLEGLRTGSVTVSHMDYVGSILPGIAAYNFYRAAPDRRGSELVASAALLAALLVVGVVAVLLWAYPPRFWEPLFGIRPAEYVAPYLLTNGADVATSLGISTRSGPTIVGSVEAVTIVVLVGLAIGETMRDRWGLKPAGVIALPIVALFALRAWWVVPLYAGIFALGYLAVQLVHRFTLLYGRALLSIAALLGVLLGFPAAVVFGLSDGVTVFFAGLLGGIGAYNLHSAAPTERRRTLLVLPGVFVAIYAAARVLVDPLASGLAATVGPPELLAAGLAVAVAGWVLLGYERGRPAAADIREGAVLIQAVPR